MKVRSRSEAEIEVYRELPYKATFQLSTGATLLCRYALLGLSYFTEEELKRLDNISAKTVWDKFTPFFDTKERTCRFHLSHVFLALDPQTMS